MSTLSVRGQLTLIELAKRTANNELLSIAEVLNETNDMLDNAVWVEANQLTSHVTTIRTSLPTGYFRAINEGVPREASSSRQIVEPMGELYAYSTIDKKLVDISPNPNQFRSDEDKAFIEGLGHTLQKTIIYGNRSDDVKQIDGLAVRSDWSSLGKPYVWGAGGTGADLTSMWLIQWGVDKVHLIYPKGSQTMGIKRTDLGEQTVYDSEYNPLQGYTSHFTADCGLVVRNPRNVQRIANIETSGSTNTLDDDLIINALNQMVSRGAGAVIYCNRTLLSQLDVLAKDKTNVTYTSGEVFGKPVTLFQGHPVRLVDQIMDTETEIPA
jgi:hypothetical protein